jgi:Carboxypeptidase regulatory-like domain
MLRPILAMVVVLFASDNLRASAPDPGRTVIDGVVVDESGAAVGGATIRIPDWGQPEVTATTGADGRFQAALNGPLANYRAIYAADSNGKRLGRALTDAMDYAPVVTTRITLKPAVDLLVSVVDATEKPVAGATVAIEDEYHLAAYGTSDVKGAVTLRVPADAKVHWVAGFRSGVGFDNFENYRAWPPPESMPVPRQVRLVLNGARSVRMRATDSAGKPLANVRFYPALMARKDKIAFVTNTGYLSYLPDGMGLPRTGPDGVATCEWFPVALKRAVPFDPVAAEYHCPASPYIDMSTGTEPEPARLLKVVTCGGRVTDPDGAPAAGLLVQAEGRGYTNHYCRCYARTGADGTYRFDLFPDQGYLITVVDADRAAEVLKNIVIREGKPRTDLDIHLITGTLIEGRVTGGAKNEPASGQTVYLTQGGATLPAELGKEVAGQTIELTRWARTGPDGRYRLRVGPGDIRVAGPDFKFTEIKVASEANLTRDFQLPRLASGLFELTVRKSDGSPAKGASVALGTTGQARADEKGTVRTLRSREPMLVYASDAAAGLAGFVRVGADDESATLTLRPAAAASGRVVGADGKAREKYTITCIARAGGSAPGESVGFTTYSDAAGAFVLPGLADGLSCQLLICNAMRCGLAPAREFTVRTTGPLKLGDVSLSPEFK